MRGTNKILLALVLLLGLVPVAAMAAGTSATCDTFAEFKAAMEDPSVETVRVKSFVETVSQKGTAAITVRSNSGTKNLVLEGSANVQAQSKNSGYRYLISVDSGMILNVSGEGSLFADPAYTDGNNALFHLHGGELHFLKTFTGTVGTETKLDGTCGSVIHVTEGNLVAENGTFSAHADCTKATCQLVHGPIYTDVSDQDNTYVVLRGGYYGYTMAKGSTSVVSGNAQNVFVDRIDYYAESIYDSVKGYIISTPAYAAWNPYASDGEPNFVLADLGETGDLSFKVQKSTFGNCFKGRAIQYAAVYQKISDTQWEKINDRKLTATEKQTVSLEASDTPTVRYYKVAVEYEYEFAGRINSFTCEREIRAEWKDLSYIGSGTKEDPVKVSDFSELRRALQDENVEYVEVVSDIDHTLEYHAYQHGNDISPYRCVRDYRMGLESAESVYDYLSSVDITDGFPPVGEILDRFLTCSALHIWGEKHLILSGDVTLKADSHPFNLNDSGFQYGIEVNSDLTISGGGTFSVTLTSPAMGPDAAAIRSRNGSDLIIEDATILARSGNITGYAHAIYVTNDGTLIIHDGEFRGQRNNDVRAYKKGFYTGAVVVADAYAEINGGTFGEYQFGQSGTDSIAGLMIDEEYLKRVTVSGGIFETGLMKADNDYGDQLTAADWETILDYGASYTTDTFTQNGVEITRVEVTPPVLVTHVELTAVQPKESERPNYAVTALGEYYQVAGGSSNYTAYRQWYESADGQSNWRLMQTTDTFQAGYYYKLHADVVTKNKALFPLYDDGTKIMPDVSATVNGYTARAIKAYDQDPSYYITVEYDFGMCNDSVIEEITVVDVVEPVPGERPSYTYHILGTGYQMNTAKNASYDAYWANPPAKWPYIKNGIGWFDLTEGDWVYDHETFILGHEYQVNVYLKTEDGFTFWHDQWLDMLFTATVNGQKAEGNTTTSYGLIEQTIMCSFVCEISDDTVLFRWQGDSCTVTPFYPETGMTVMAAGYQNSKMTGVQYITGSPVTLTGDTVKVFFLDEDQIPVREALCSTKP